jgi:hypothetical protein
VRAVITLLDVGAGNSVVGGNAEPPDQVGAGSVVRLGFSDRLRQREPLGLSATVPPTRRYGAVAPDHPHRPRRHVSHAMSTPLLDYAPFVGNVGDHLGRGGARRGHQQVDGP